MEDVTRRGISCNFDFGDNYSAKNWNYSGQIDGGGLMVHRNLLYPGKGMRKLI